TTGVPSSARSIAPPTLHPWNRRSAFAHELAARSPSGLSLRGLGAGTSVAGIAALLGARVVQTDETPSAPSAEAPTAPASPSSSKPPNWTAWPEATPHDVIAAADLLLYADLLYADLLYADL